MTAECSTKEKAKNEILGAVLEFSKKIVISIIALFALQMLAGVVAIMIDGTIAVPLTQYMDSCKPIYITCIAGYDVKAGIENALKISNAVKQISSVNTSGSSGSG